MFKGRGLLFLLIIIALAVIAFLLLRRGGQLPSLLGRRQTQPAIPLDLQTIIPTGWQPQTDLQLACDFDGDREPERLLIYRYNQTTVQKPLEKAGELETFAPFGGVIFDTQSAQLGPQINPPGAYRPGNIVPYLLLPDFYPGKGEGYLGDSRVELRYAPTPKEGEGCSTSEINVFGFSGYDLPTRLSVFRWRDRESGYQGAHFAGNARVESNISPDGGNYVTEVTTYNRLLNHRSVLCEVNRYSRVGEPGATPDLTFLGDAAVRTIDFCFEAPAEPMYPEGVVVALLRGQSNGSAQPLPYLLDDVELPRDLELRGPGRKTYNVLSVGNPSFVVPLPSDGYWCRTEQVGAANAGPVGSTPTSGPTAVTTPTFSNRLWCERERVRIETRVMIDGAPRDFGWVLISVRPDAANGGVYWRIKKVEAL